MSSTPLIEPLEARLCLSVAFQTNPMNWGDSRVSLDHGLLTLHGGSGNDRITFSVSLSPGRVPRVFPYVGNAKASLVVKINTNSVSVPFSDIQQIRIDAGGGNDKVLMLEIPRSPYCYMGAGWVYPNNGRLLGWGDKPTVIVGGDGNDTIVGGDLNDTIFGGAGDDLIYGRNGDDRLLGMAGNDTLLGNGGNDFIDGGAGNDILWGDYAAMLALDPGNDTLLGRNGNDQLYGGPNNDDLFGGNGNDLMWGNQQFDSGFAGKGHDGGNGFERAHKSIERAIDDPFAINTCL